MKNPRTVDKADIITLGDSDTHNANDTCLDISDFRGGGEHIQKSSTFSEPLRPAGKHLIMQLIFTFH
jgi:hypothetical protein